MFLDATGGSPFVSKSLSDSDRTACSSAFEERLPWRPGDTGRRNPPETLRSFNASQVETMSPQLDMANSHPSDDAPLLILRNHSTPVE